MRGYGAHYAAAQMVDTHTISTMLPQGTMRFPSSTWLTGVSESECHTVGSVGWSRYYWGMGHFTTESVCYLLPIPCVERWGADIQGTAQVSPFFSVMCQIDATVHFRNIMQDALKMSRFTHLKSRIRYTENS